MTSEEEEELKQLITIMENGNGITDPVVYGRVKELTQKKAAHLKQDEEQGWKYFHESKPEHGKVITAYFNNNTVKDYTFLIDASWMKPIPLIWKYKQ